MENIVRLPLFFGLLYLLSACATNSSPSKQLSLDRGAYRIEGQCVSMTNRSQQEKEQCLGYVGIVAKDPDRPHFLFSRVDGGAWLFVVGAQPKYSNGGKTGQYPISSLLDSSSNRAFDLPGECVVNTDSYPTVSCSIWLKDGKKIREVIFNGSGTWMFSRE